MEYNIASSCLSYYYTTCNKHEQTKRETIYTRLPGW